MSLAGRAFIVRASLLTMPAAICVLLTLLLVQVLAIAKAHPEAGPRSHLPGVTLVEGRQAPFLQHQPVSTLRVYAFHGASAVQIPFQVDERDQRGRWVLAQGPRQNRDDPPGEFDENDVIVFMNRDLGDRGNPANLPHEATIWGEIRVGNAAQPLGFAYVGVFNSPPLLQPETPPYARYDPRADRVYAARYALAFDAPLPTHLALVNQLGDFGTNTIAGIHASGEVRFIGGLFTLRRTDKDIRAELLAYRDGPVRVIRRARYWIPLPLGFRTSGRVDLLFYRDFVEGTALVKLKIPPRLVLADGELMTYFDFLDLSGARLLLDGEQPSEPVNGRMTPAKRALTGRPAHWAALLLPDGRTVLLIVRLEGALQRLEQRLYFADTTLPGNSLGGKPIFGFQFSRVNRLETGAHRLSVFGVVLEDTHITDLPWVAGLFLSPPAVNVSLLQKMPRK